MHRYSVYEYIQCIYLDKETKTFQIKLSSQHFMRDFFFFIRLAKSTYLRNLGFVSQKLRYAPKQTSHYLHRGPARQFECLSWEKVAWKSFGVVVVITCNKLIFTETVRPKCEKPRLKEEMENKLNHCSSCTSTGNVTAYHVNIFKRNQILPQRYILTTLSRLLGVMFSISTRNQPGLQTCVAGQLNVLVFTLRVGIRL